MIDFRYHIVSIVAIFIALAVGIVLGSGPLEDNISGFLENRTKALAAEKLALQKDVANLEDQVADADAYAALVQPRVVAGVLTGRDVVVVAMPGASDSDRKATEQVLAAAGAVVTEQVRVTDAWTDPEQADVLDRVTQGLTKGPVDTDAYAAASAVVADALVTSSARLEGDSAPNAIADLAAYQEAGFLEVADLQSVTLASAAVFVVSDASDVDTSQAQQQTTTLLPLVAAVDSSDNGTAVVGPTGSASPTGLVAAVRGSDVADTVSTVDWLDTTAGTSVVVLTLDEQLKGSVGHYGTGDGAGAVGPELPAPAG